MRFNDDECIYELVGVTVHTGTAEGGHYYSFIRNRDNQQGFLFNDSEIKPFDAASQLANECFGGETTSKTYDPSSDGFMNLSFVKTNLAYTLFYKRKAKRVVAHDEVVRCNDQLAQAIREDNLKFLSDKQIFDHGYFGFVWHLCESRGSVAAELTASF